jgi:hypothetical protein
MTHFLSFLGFGILGEIWAILYTRGEIMGQRSEIYVAVEKQDGTKQMTARYFSWNYAERMISRVAFTSKWLQARQLYGFNKEDLISIIETNFDMVDHIASERIEPSTTKPFKLHCSIDNGLNDGRAFIFINKEGKIKYCFTENHALKPLDCNKYMLFDTKDCYPNRQWGNKEYRNSTKMKSCRNNIKWLKQNAEVMTQKELDEFLYSVYIA